MSLFVLISFKKILDKFLETNLNNSCDWQDLAPKFKKFVLMWLFNGRDIFRMTTTYTQLVVLYCKPVQKKMFYSLTCFVGEGNCLSFIWLWARKHFDGYCACIMPAISKGYSCARLFLTAILLPRWSSDDEAQLCLQAKVSFPNREVSNISSSRGIFTLCCPLIPPPFS